MPFKERFFEKIIKHSVVFGDNFPLILNKQETIDDALKTLGDNTVISLSSLVGSELGGNTRAKVTSEATDIDSLKDSFKEHMSHYGINVAYGADNKAMYIELNKCIFTEGGVKKRFCNYSKNFLEKYFNATAE